MRLDLADGDGPPVPEDESRVAVVLLSQTEGHAVGPTLQGESRAGGAAPVFAHHDVLTVVARHDHAPFLLLLLLLRRVVVVGGALLSLPLPVVVPVQHQQGAHECPRPDH